MMFAVGFGWAKPVPVDMRYFKNPKAGMALTALAGPVSNLLLALLAVFLSREIYVRGTWIQRRTARTLVKVLSRKSQSMDWMRPPRSMVLPLSIAASL